MGFSPILHDKAYILLVDNVQISAENWLMKQVLWFPIADILLIYFNFILCIHYIKTSWSLVLTVPINIKMRKYHCIGLIILCIIILVMHLIIRQHQYWTVKPMLYSSYNQKLLQWTEKTDCWSIVSGFSPLRRAGTHSFSDILWQGMKVGISNR